MAPFVGGLTRDDFAVTEDGRPQQIAVFERQSELPLNLTLAIDTSGSVHKDLGEEADAARRFAHALLRPQDQMSLMQFATDVQELTPFTNKLGQIDRGLDQLHGDFATALYDAIYLGLPAPGRQGRPPRPGLVSDGDDTAESTTYAQALEQALRNEVMIYTIIDVPIEASAGRDIGGEHALITLAEQTGGKSFYVERGRPRQGLRPGQRRPAHAVFAGILSKGSRARKGLPPHPGHYPPRRPRRLRHPPQNRLLRQPAGYQQLTCQPTSESPTVRPTPREPALLLLSCLLRPRRRVGRHRCADQLLERSFVDRLPFTQIDSPPHISFQAGIEQPLRVFD